MARKENRRDIRLVELLCDELEEKYNLLDLNYITPIDEVEIDGSFKRVRHNIPEYYKMCNTSGSLDRHYITCMLKDLVNIETRMKSYQ